MTTRPRMTAREARWAHHEETMEAIQAATETRMRKMGVTARPPSAAQAMYPKQAERDEQRPRLKPTPRKPAGWKEPETRVGGQLAATWPDGVGRKASAPPASDDEPRGGGFTW